MHHAHLDKFASHDAPIHRLHRSVKFIVVLIFTVVVISLSRTSPAILACYAVGPFTILVLGKIPLRFAIRQILIVSPFVLILALSSPLYDKTPVAVTFGPFGWQITLGWMRCFTILAKFSVTMAALIALVSTTKFADLLAGLQKLALPKILVIQLAFIYRYIFVLINRVHHILRARQIRKLKNLGFKKELKTAAAMVGSLLVRSIDMAENISIAMQGRGFSGQWHSTKELQIQRADYIFAASAAVFMFGLYFFIRPVLI